MFRFLDKSCFSNLIEKRERAIVFNTDVIFLIGLDPILWTYCKHMNISTDINELIAINGTNFNEIARCIFV